jgi:hypothetical protein
MLSETGAEDISPALGHPLGNVNVLPFNECLCLGCSSISSFILAAVEVTLCPLLSDLLSCVAVSSSPSSHGREPGEHTTLIR